MAVDPKTSIIQHCMQNEPVFTVFANRITADKIPDGQEPPFARVKLIASNQDYHSQGEGGRAYLMQIDVYDEELLNADANTELLRVLFSGYQGKMGNMTTGRVTAKIVQSIWNESLRLFWRVLEIEVPTND